MLALGGLMRSTNPPPELRSPPLQHGASTGAYAWAVDFLRKFPREETATIKHTALLTHVVHRGSSVNHFVDEIAHAGSSPRRMLLTAGKGVLRCVAWVEPSHENCGH